MIDGSNIMSDMAHQCWAGSATRGMTMCVLSNGGGVGTGKGNILMRREMIRCAQKLRHTIAINGGFGLVLDGSERVDAIIRSAIDFDVTLGVGRRAWARNENALEATREWNERNAGRGHVTLPSAIDTTLIDNLLK
jgi:urocanate hydratase